MSNTVSVLHVDDDPSFGSLVAEFLSREEVPFEVHTEHDARAGLERLADNATTVDCVVSDYEMPAMDGLEFLDALRDDHPELPFILFTGKGSEAVASEAISAGATDYLQKGGGSEKYELLANRVHNAVDQYHSRRERDRVYQALESATEGIGVLDADGEYVFLNESYAALYDHDPADLVGRRWSALYPADEVRRFENEILPRLASEGDWSGESRGLAAGGDTFPEEVSLTQLDDGGHVCVVRDISTRRERDRRFRTLVGNLRGMVYRCENEPSWPITDVQGDVERFIGYTADELTSGAVDWAEEVLHPDDRDRAWERVQSQLETAETFELTYRVRTNAGETRTVRERGRGIFADDGSIAALEGLIVDITDSGS